MVPFMWWLVDSLVCTMSRGFLQSTSPFMLISITSIFCKDNVLFQNNVVLVKNNSWYRPVFLLHQHSSSYEQQICIGSICDFHVSAVHAVGGTRDQVLTHRNNTGPMRNVSLASAKTTKRVGTLGGPLHYTQLEYERFKQRSILVRRFKEDRILNQVGLKAVLLQYFRPGECWKPHFFLFNLAEPSRGDGKITIHNNKYGGGWLLWR